jgi:hypothetical protein
LLKCRIANGSGDRKKRIRGITSLSKHEQNQILKHTTEYPFDNSVKIKNALKLNCTCRTILNFLKSKGIRPYFCKETPHLNAHNLQLKDQFCNLVKDVTVNDWKCVVFSDEKILQSYHNSKMRVMRKRGNGMDRR